MIIDYETEVMAVARTGRPRLENPRKEGVFIRLTENEHTEIVEYASEHSLTITETIVKGFQALKSQNPGNGE
ncbi:MAG: CopG family transcriptional regulator [Mobilitalea sp.]